MMGGSCWRRFGRNKGINKGSLRQSSSRVGASPRPMPQAPRGAYSARGGVG
jgi:hypothetical protein